MNNIFSDNPTWAIGLIFGLFGIIAVHRLLMHRDKKNIFNSAANDFINTIHSELKDIYPIPANWPENINGFLREKFPTLQAAVNAFAKHLPESDQTAFFLAWSIYRLGKDSREIDKQDYHQYEAWTGAHRLPETDKLITEDNTKTYKDNFKKNVDNLLKYAKKI